MALSESGYRLISPSPRSEIPARIDFEEDARDLSSSLAAEPAHVIGHSYGGLTAIHLAATRPGSVRSLLLIEPAAMSVARGVPEVERHVEAVEDVFGRAHEMTTEEFGNAFAAALGSTPRGATLTAAAHLELELLRRKRLPWTAELPLAEIRAATYPRLVVSGGSEPLYEAVADRLASAIGADREVVQGAGHRVQDAPVFNDLLRTFFGRSSP